jgi:hypothetical protein
MARIKQGSGFWLALPMFGLVLPFLLALFLMSESTAEQDDDYLPSSRARAASLKITKLAKSYPDERAGMGGVALAVGRQAHVGVHFQIFIITDQRLDVRHFHLLTRRLARSPPSFLL